MGKLILLNLEITAKALELYDQQCRLLDLIAEYGLCHPDSDDANRWWPDTSKEYATMKEIAKVEKDAIDAATE